MFASARRNHCSTATSNDFCNKIGPNLPNLIGQSMSALPGISDVNLFRYRKGVINLDAKISDGAFDLGVAEQKLHSTQVARAPVDQCRLGSSE
jgi:hypothetical protein